MSTNYRVETHILRNNDILDELTFMSKNLYNRANYLVRQEFIETSKLKEQGLVEYAKYLGFFDIENILKDEEEYKDLSAQTRQSILRLLDKNWKSFFKAIKVWMKCKNKFTGKPNLPNYLNKKGRFLLIYPGQNIRIDDEGYLRIPKSDIRVKTKITKEQLKELRIIPKGNKTFKIEIIYVKKFEDLGFPESQVIGIDIGLNNLMAVASNESIGLCCLINGRPLKSINQYFNKVSSKLKSILKTINGKDFSKRLWRLNFKRQCKINDYLHKASRILINLCKETGVGKIIIGHNDGWKQDINLGKKTNQNFVQIPFNNLIQMIKYKAEELGIKVEIIEESYTSKIDHLVLEEMKHQDTYLGKGVKRGLFKSSSGVELNADLNGALGIIRKSKNVACEEFLRTLASRGCVLQPLKLSC